MKLVNLAFINIHIYAPVLTWKSPPGGSLLLQQSTAQDGDPFVLVVPAEHSPAWWADGTRCTAPASPASHSLCHSATSLCTTFSTPSAEGDVVPLQWWEGRAETGNVLALRIAKDILIIFARLFNLLIFCFRKKSSFYKRETMGLLFPRVSYSHTASGFHLALTRSLYAAPRCDV